MSENEPAFEPIESVIVPPAAPFPWRALLAPLFLVVLGVAALAVTGTVEVRRMAKEPWCDAVVAPEDEYETDGAIPVHVRELPAEDPDLKTGALDQLQKLLDEQKAEIGLVPQERVIAVELPVERLRPLLASGRLPDPTKPEALAGDLTRRTAFTLDGVRFNVVGRLRQTVSGFTCAYLVPYVPVVMEPFSSGDDLSTGTLLIDGIGRIDELMPDTDDEDAPVLWGGQTRTLPGFAECTFLGLVLVALGGVWTYLRAFRLLADQPTGIFAASLREMGARPKLFIGMHILMYGVFFAAMLAGSMLPLANFSITQYIGDMFSGGELSYIGDAYASGNILRAAFATFFNNYVVQTLGFTFAVSLIPLALGVFKTAASFALVGFGMAPIWAGTATGYSYHALTMVLEFEGYIVACFAVTAWALCWCRVPFKGITKAEAAQSVAMFLSGAALSGVLLAIAALYEATTLILFK